MPVDAIQGNAQVPRTEQYQTVRPQQPQQPQQVQEKPKEEPTVKQQGQTEDNSYINTFA